MNQDQCYKIKWRDKYADDAHKPKGKKKNKPGPWIWAVHDKNPNRGKHCEFPKRQKAAQWIRNHQYEIDIKTVVIVHPDGTLEKWWEDCAEHIYLDEEAPCVRCGHISHEPRDPKTAFNWI